MVRGEATEKGYDPEEMMMKSGLELTRIIPNGRELVPALGWGTAIFAGRFATLSDAPGDKQPGGTLSLPPPMASVINIEKASHKRGSDDIIRV